MNININKVLVLLMFVCISSRSLADLFLAIPIDASQEEFDALNKLIQQKIDRYYVIELCGQKFEKNKVMYFCANWDVDRRKLDWKIDAAKADIVKEEAKTPTLTNVVVEVKKDEKFTPSAAAVVAPEEPKPEEPVE